MVTKRYLTENIVSDLKEKMVFLGGPRQVGKTTLCNKLVGENFGSMAYFNWDSKTDRQKINAGEWPLNTELIIFDEIHKMKNWKSFIKGEYDTKKEQNKFLITGSSRLNVYRKGSDSLQGRYHYYVLHPFSLAETNNIQNQTKPFEELSISTVKDIKGFDELEKFGGFPEPFIKQNERTLRRWHEEKLERLVKEDIRDTEFVRDLSQLQLLSDMLPSKVGSIFSLNALREDLEVSHKAVSHWMKIFETFYYCFRIHPFTSTPYRSHKKEPKLYLWDWSEVTNEAARFENMVASHLLKFTDYLHDSEGYKTELYFLRDSNKKEVDFLVTVDNKPWFAVEAKLNDEKVESQVHSFKEKLKIPFVYQVIKKSGISKMSGNTIVVSADAFLSALI